MSKEVHDVLVRARERISEPKKWTQGALARTAAGRPIGVRSDEATCWCLDGALWLAAGGAALEADDAYYRAGNSLRRLLCTRSYIGFNDSPLTTHAQVLALLDRAIDATRPMD